MRSEKFLYFIQTELLIKTNNLPISMLNVQQTTVYLSFIIAVFPFFIISIHDTIRNFFKTKHNNFLGRSHVKWCNGNELNKKNLTSHFYFYNNKT